jgi:hypothetical protein
MQEKVLNNQSLFDVAVQRLGDISVIFDLADRNGLSITDDIPSGTSLLMPTAAKGEVVNYYSNNDYKPATSITKEQINVITGDGEGIEFWFVEYDFVVQ